MKGLLILLLIVALGVGVYLNNWIVVGASIVVFALLYAIIKRMNKKPIKKIKI